MGNRERIIAYLTQHAEGADDDHLAAALRISPRQTVNQICRALAATKLIERRPGSAGKIINTLPDPRPGVPSDGAEAVLFAETSAEAALLQAPARMVWFRDALEMREFVQTGEVRISEDHVKAAVRSAFDAEGWSTQVRWGRAHGIDIEAWRSQERWVIEAKGEGSRSAMRVNYFVGALGELIQRMDSAEPRYALALPAHRQFIGLVRRLPDWVRQRLQLSFLLVRQTGTTGDEVGVLAPEINLT